MSVKKVWDKSRSNFSFEKLLLVAAGFANIENSGEDVCRGGFAKMTYIDEDGDEVNISSDDELKNAFLQILAVLPLQKPLLIKVTFAKGASYLGVCDGLKKSQVLKEEVDDEVKTTGMPSCPITGVQMIDPVVAADGNTYDRHAITKWLQTSNRSPLTREVLAHYVLVPNYLLLSK